MNPVNGLTTEELGDVQLRFWDHQISQNRKQESTIRAAEQFWSQKIAEQNANAGLIAESLTMLFKEMYVLQSIHIGQWHFRNHSELAFERYVTILS